MARAAFINPSQDFKKIYGGFSEERSVLPPLGLCYLASVLKSCGHEVKIIDAPALRISNETAVKMALEWGAGYVGITSTTDTIYISGDIADKLKSLSKDINYPVSAGDKPGVQAVRGNIDGGAVQ